MVRKGSHSRGPDGATILAPGHQGATSASAELSKRPTVLASAGTWVITAYQTSAGGPPCVHSPRPPASVWSWPADPSLGRADRATRGSGGGLGAAVVRGLQAPSRARDVGGDGRCRGAQHHAPDQAP